jgi:hypothetical protein
MTVMVVCRPLQQSMAFKARLMSSAVPSFPLPVQRIQACKDKGFVAVEPDNVDGEGHFQEWAHLQLTQVLLTGSIRW